MFQMRSQLLFIVYLMSFLHLLESYGDFDALNESNYEELMKNAAWDRSEYREKRALGDGGIGMAIEYYYSDRM